MKGAVPLVILMFCLLATIGQAQSGITIVEGAEWKDGNLVAWQNQRFYLDAFNETYSTIEYHYDWDMGDGIRREGPIVSHSYSEVGTYRVTMEIMNATGMVHYMEFNVEVRESTTYYQMFLLTMSIIGVPLAILAFLNVVVIVTGRLWRRLKHPKEPYVKWKLRSITMFNLLLITVPLAFFLSPIYIVPAVLGCLFWIFLGYVFVKLAPTILKVWRYDIFAEFMGERLCVIEREVTYYAPIKGSIWRAVKQRSGVALEMLAVPLFGVFVLTALYFKVTGSLEEALRTPSFYVVLGLAPFYTSFMAIIRMLKDSNLAFISPSQVRVQFVGDIFEKSIQKVGLLGSMVALFQIVVILSPSIESAWGTMLVIIPLITGLVLAYMFLTAFVYLGFHPTLVNKLNAALEESKLPKYVVEKENGFLSIHPPRSNDVKE
ncbi:MAG TPA: PKD domain-containing protein [Euryarchaeota archaeon]|nr:PKD domain-containing protein [Euryarchaeota archaeon]